MRRNGTDFREKLDKLQVGQETYIGATLGALSSYTRNLRPKRFRSESREGGQLVRRIE